MTDKSTPIHTLKKTANQGGLNVMNNPPPMPESTRATDVVPNQMPQHMPQQQKVPDGLLPQELNTYPQVDGPSQGNSTSKIKEFFSNSDYNVKSTLLVFALVLIFTSSIFFSTVGTQIPGVVTDGKVTLLGTFLSAVLIALIYLLIRMVVKI